MKRLWPLALLALAWAAPAPAASLEHLRPGERPSPGSTEAELWYGMDQAEKHIRSSPYVVRDPALNAYVREVLCKVTGDYCQDLRLYIVDIPVFNASMAPNGVTLVFTGALLRMRDEAELAVVLGHEFAHYKARHSLEGWNSAKRTTAFLTTFGLVTLGVGAPLAGDLALLAGVGGLFKQSRDNEREADRLGFEVAVANGYDPQAGVRLWERLRREERADRTHKDRAVFASHPQTEERVADIRAAAAKHSTEGMRNVEAYHAAIRPFLPRWLRAELSRRTYDTTVQVLTELKRDSPPDLAALHTFYLAEAYRRRNKGDDATKAAALYAEAVSLPDPPVEAWREHGLQLRAQNRHVEAADALHRYLEAAPNADDAALMRHYLTQLETMP